jgi:hypothetical protein
VKEEQNTWKQNKQQIKTRQFMQQQQQWWWRQQW